MSLISDALILWYNHHQRDLPWRHTHDPYLIWVSEIILQQTQVVTGIDYYLRITHKYPNVLALASASEDDVLKMWQGLGYYSRARNMLIAAQHVAENHSGIFPVDYHELLKLKGVGPYTAAAIASFAGNLPHAVVDGNVARVLSRLFAMAEPIDSVIGKKELDLLAHQVMNSQQAGMHNQAMIELGALVCRPLRPLCHECPLTVFCMAHQRQTAEAFPVKSKRVVVRHRYLIYMYFENAGKVCIERRNGDDIWKGLYQLPLIELPHAIRQESILSDVSDFMGISTPELTVNIQRESRHLLTHQRLHLTFVNVSIEAVAISEFTRRYEQVDKKMLHQYAFPKPLVDFLFGRKAD